MKKILTIVLLSLAVLFIFADEPESMRSVATNGVFTDTWEDVYDPIFLQSIDKFYFFTNFADFSLEHNENFGEISDDSDTKFFEEFPFGIAFTNPFKENLKHAFFVRFRNTLTPEMTDNGNLGEYEESVIYYSGSTWDNVFETKEIVYTKEENYQDNDNLFDFIWNNNLELENYNLGFKFALFTSKDEIDDAQSRLGVNNFGSNSDLDGFYSGANQLDTYSEFYNIHEDEYFLKYKQKGEFSTVIEEKQMNFLLSLEKDSDLFVKDNSLRFDLGFDITHALSLDTDDSYHGSYENIVLRDTLIKTGNISDTYKRKINMNEKYFYLATCLNKEIDSRFNGEKGFWEVGLSSGYLFGDKENFREEHLISAEKIDSLNSLEYTILNNSNHYTYSEESGDFTGFDISSYFLMNLPLNNSANFGYGLTYNFSHQMGNYDVEYQIENVDVYQIGQNIDTEDEYTTTETQYISGEKESVVTNSEFIIPVALEFKIPENHTSNNDGFGLRNFLFRIGSTFVYDYTTTENTYNTIENQINFIITEYGDGTVGEDHDASNELMSDKEIIKRATSSKIFTAGIGYEHSENVSIDLAGRYNYNTEDYFLGLSFTISK
ncbi:hypothetical protein JEZ13_04455 [bacterium]|nr:hypothetical protein [bacterium]